MTNKHRNKMDNNSGLEIRQVDEPKADDLILEIEKDAIEEKTRSARELDGAGSAESVKKIGEKISTVLVLVLLIISIIQSVELYNLRSLIVKGQFTTGTPASTAGSGQSLPSQQGGC